MILIIVVLAGLLLWQFLAKEHIDLKQYITAEWKGFETQGTIQVTFKDQEVKAALIQAYHDSQKNIFSMMKQTDQTEVDALYNSIMWSVDHDQGLKNGDVVTLSFQCDEELAKKLRIEIEAEPTEFTVQGLQNGKVVTKEELFEHVSVSFSGISPEAKIAIINTSEDPFLKTVDFFVEIYQENYEIGERVSVQAFWDAEQALLQGYDIKADVTDCKKEYIVENVDQYITRADQIPPEVLDAVIAKGATLFTNGNDYGQRIFSEAHLNVSWTGGKTHFVWGTPSLLSIYFKALKPDVTDLTGKDYNDLDVIYLAPISQDDGVACKAEAVVRLSNLILRADGTYDMDAEKTRFISASYNNSSIIQNIITKYEDDYTVEKITR